MSGRIEPNMTDADYHAHEALSKTKLSDFIESPLLYYHKHISGLMSRKSETTQMMTGSIIHECVLLGRPLNEVCAVIPKDCLTANGSINSRGKAWQDFCLEATGYRVKRQEYEQLKAMLAADSIQQLRRFVNSSSMRRTIECPIFWTDEQTGIECRCKPDWFVEQRNGVECYDLKVSPMISPQQFKSQLKRFRYWLQDRHYSKGLRALTGLDVTFTFVVVEPAFPFRVAMYHLDNDAKALGDAEYRRQLGRYAECVESGDWRDDWERSISLTVWDVGAEVESDSLNWEG